MVNITNHGDSHEVEVVVRKSACHILFAKASSGDPSQDIVRTKNCGPLYDGM